MEGSSDNKHSSEAVQKLETRAVPVPWDWEPVALIFFCGFCFGFGICKIMLIRC